MLQPGWRRTRSSHLAASDVPQQWIPVAAEAVRDQQGWWGGGGGGAGGGRTNRGGKGTAPGALGLSSSYVLACRLTYMRSALAESIAQRAGSSPMQLKYYTDADPTYANCVQALTSWQKAAAQTS